MRSLGFRAMLWFDVEERYNTTKENKESNAPSCGLMQKKDITQQETETNINRYGCGLMQKKDITQLFSRIIEPLTCCGLMQKKDITQLL